MKEEEKKGLRREARGTPTFASQPSKGDEPTRREATLAEMWEETRSMHYLKIQGKKTIQ